VAFLLSSRRPPVLGDPTRARRCGGIGVLRYDVAERRATESAPGGEKLGGLSSLMPRSRPSGMLPSGFLHSLILEMPCGAKRSISAWGRKNRPSGDSSGSAPRVFELGGVIVSDT